MWRFGFPALRLAFLIPILLLEVSTMSFGQEEAQEEVADPCPTRDAQPDGEGAAGRRPVASVSEAHFTGRIVMEDGGALPGDLWVELACHGRILKQALVDSKGRFGLEMGSMVGSDSFDSAVAGNLGSPTAGLWTPRTIMALTPAALRGCELRLAPRAGLQARGINLSSIDVSSHPDLGTIVVHRIGTRERISPVSVTTLRAPQKARKALDKAQKELAKPNPSYPRVVQELERALEEYPSFTEAWYLLGLVRLRSNETQSAREALLRATETDRAHTASYLELARLEVGAGNWGAACEVTGRLVEFAPNLPQALYLDAIAHFYAGRLKRAQASLLELVAAAQGKHYPLTFFYLAMIDRERREFQRSAEEFRQFLGLAKESEVPTELRGAIQSQIKEWSDLGLITD